MVWNWPCGLTSSLHASVDISFLCESVFTRGEIHSECYFEMLATPHLYSWVFFFFCLLIDGKCLQNLIQIEKSKNTAFVHGDSLLQMSCLHILKLKINTPLYIRKNYFSASAVGGLWISSLAAGSHQARQWFGLHRACNWAQAPRDAWLCCRQ